MAGKNNNLVLIKIRETVNLFIIINEQINNSVNLFQKVYLLG